MKRAHVDEKIQSDRVQWKKIRKIFFIRIKSTCIKKYICYICEKIFLIRSE
jgi:hypothetical protein